MFYPHISAEDILKIMSGKDRFVRVEIPGPGNPGPKIFLPRGLKRDQSILVQHQIYAAYWELFPKDFNHEAQHWALMEDISNVERLGENAAAITTMVFRNPEFLYRLNTALIDICNCYAVNIRVFWQGKEYLQAFEHAPKFDIPAPDYRVCPFCGKRFVPIGRNADRQTYCTVKHEEKARYRRAYLRRKQRQGVLSESEKKELHGLEN